MNEPPLSAERVYSETCNSIRSTDDISFKLMGFVPLVSGATLFTFFLKEPIAPQKADLVVGLALLAALVTLGLFRWELRNIQTCNWLKRRAEALERNMAIAKLPKPPTGIGKTEAEKWIYSITILAWLSTPPLVVPVDKPPFLLPAYVAVTLVIAVVTILSALTDVRVAQMAEVSARHDA